MREKKKLSMKNSKWSERWEIPFDVNKHCILKIGTRDPKSEYEINGIKLENVQRDKDLNFTIASNVKLFQHCKDAAANVNRMLDFINKNSSFQSKDTILLLYISQTPSGICCAILVTSPLKIYRKTNYKLSIAELRRYITSFPNT